MCHSEPVLRSLGVGGLVSESKRDFQHINIDPDSLAGGQYDMLGYAKTLCN